MQGTHALVHTQEDSAHTWHLLGTPSGQGLQLLSAWGQPCLSVRLRAHICTSLTRGPSPAWPGAQAG